MGREGKEYNYKKESMYTSIPGAGYQYTGGDQVWNLAAIKNYFYQCVYKLKPFNEHSSEVVKAMYKFINDDEHSGEEANASKQFLNENLSLIVIDTVLAIQKLEGMMVEPGFQGSIPIVRAFLDELNEDETALITKSALDKIIIDFSRYLRDFKEQSEIIKEGRAEAEETLKACEEFINAPCLTYLRPYLVDISMSAFVNTTGTVGTIPLFRKNFLAFLEEHNDDFSKSEYKTLIDRICSNLKRIEVGLGDGSFDPQSYNENLKNIVYDAGEYNAEYEDYIDSYQRYIMGYYSKTAAYVYDPININNGNFVSRKVDITVGKKHPISVERNYNAQIGKVGVFGKGWTFNYEQHLIRKDDSFTLFCGDGKECVFNKANLNGEEVFLEIHGEEGVLRVMDDGYRITYDDNSFIDFDNDGYLVYFGDNYGRHTSVEYYLFEKNADDKIVKIALPRKVITKEGSYLSFEYNDLGLITKAKDHTGRTVTYAYEDVNDQYRLTTIVGTNGKAQRFRYTDNGLIKEAVRSDGVVGVTNEYDSRNRIVKQILANGGEFKFDYDDEKHTVTVTEANGCKVEYLKDEIGRHIGTRYLDLGLEDKFTYNSKGQKVSQTDKRGFTTRYSYDNRGHLTSVIGPEGLHESFTYYVDGKISSKKDSEGNVTKYKYDLKGNLYSVTNANGEKTRFYYDEEGKVISVRNANNERSQIAYDEKGNISEVTDECGITTQYEYDLLGRVIATEDNAGNRTEYCYDANDNLIRVVDPEGNTTSYEYNSLGKVASVTNPDGTRKSWEYNEIGKPASFTDEDNRTTRVYYNISTQEERIVLPNNGCIQYEYDIVGRRTGVIDAVGRKTIYEFDKAGNKLASYKIDIQNGKSDEKKLVSSFAYDGRGRMISETDGDGHTTKYVYDKNSNLIEKIDATGGKYLYKYDALKRVVETTDPIGRKTFMSYNATGKLASTTDYSGVVTVNEYENGRIKKVVRKAGNVEQLVREYEYDSCGRVIKSTEADGLSFKYVYDKAGRKIAVIGSDGKEIRYSYDPCGRVTEVSKSGAITKYTYTRTGKLNSVTDPLGGVTKYTYDELDNICKTERFGNSSDDEKDRVTIFEHNLAGELISITDALGQKDLYTYDVFGNLKTHIDRDGNEIAYSRDSNGNITGINYSDGKSVKLKYNALNVIEEIRDHLGTTKIEYDAVGRMTKVTDFEGRTVGYEYAPTDAKTQIIYPDGSIAKYSYNAFGKLSTLSNYSDNNSGESTISYEYNDAGRLMSKVLPNGITTSYDYYQGGLLKDLTIRDEDGVLDKYEYHYDVRNIMDSVKRVRRDLDEISGIYDYEHDLLGRLTKTSFNGNVKAMYEYDAFGNRIKMSEGNSSTEYHYDALDRLMDSVALAAGKETRSRYGYDKRGNQTALYVNDVLQSSYEYDATNMMVRAYDKEMGEVSYSYNGLGYRVRSERPEEVTKYLCDLSMEYHNLLEREVNGQKQSFVYDHQVALMKNDGDNFYYLNDELGSSMYLTGTDGSTVGTYSYDDFGRRVDPFTGNVVDKKNRSYVKDGNVLQPFAFTGYTEDDATGLFYAQARYYDGETGRFAGEDQVRGYLESTQSINHYIYCLNNPQNLVDRNGKDPDDFHTYDPTGQSQYDLSEAEKYGLIEAVAIHTYQDRKAVKESGTNTTPGCLVDAVDYSDTGEGQYVGAIYLLARDGAFHQGHAAVILVKDNGEADCFSIGGAPNVQEFRIDGYFGTNCGSGTQAPMDYSEFLLTGNLPHDTISSQWVNGTGDDLYTNFAYFPITDEEGKAMYQRAIDRRADYMDEDGEAYDVLNNNCGQNAQTVLGPFAFAPDEIDYNLFMSKPNVQYLTIVDMINNGERTGYYGTIDDLRNAYCNL
ncbi:DUF6531 domain-containing protein [Butyrivibrio proteoclasticus]|uniref:DUF6531 domain-containing protein n=1 Tax=Butyrivibrio proteoclasticus TaxID=43305 RepID=UPI00047AD767|nr:DUF6531 domain-containing protein [Butyrivibrio proteoclasticus]